MGQVTEALRESLIHWLAIHGDQAMHVPATLSEILTNQALVHISLGG